MDALYAYFASLDVPEWGIHIFGLLFVVLLLRFCYDRINVGDTYSESRLLDLSVLVTGMIWGGLLAFEWLLPVVTTVYVVNASDDAFVVTAGDEGFCLPAKSYHSLVWRIDPPDTIAVTSAKTGAKVTDPVGKGEWFVNTTPSVVSIDLIDYDAKTINPDAIAIQQSGSMRINVGGEKPFQLYSQLPIDRVSYGEGDILERHTGLPCPSSAPPY